MDHLCKRRSRGRLLHRTPEGTLLKRGGGGCNAGNVVKEELRPQISQENVSEEPAPPICGETPEEPTSPTSPRPHGPEPRDSRLQTPDVSGERDPWLQRLRREVPDGLPLQRAECSWGRRGPCHGARRGGGSAASSPSPRPPPDASHSLPHATSATYNQH